MDENSNKQHDRIEVVDLEQEMRKYYIDYAMSVIAARALPDVRDGMKPVHRRIMYAMSELNLSPDKPYRKSARIVGDTMGKYHPHGDSSIYDAMVRMAQDFSTRYMLVDGHGNFGSVDGDGAAAMRYTEARLSKISMELLADINKNTVDFVPNFDDSLKEPSVLPCRFPNLLVNGTGGIAVGMATNIPPHNLNEVIDGVVKIIDNYTLENRETTMEELLAIIKGPDFPTGATIYGTQGIEQAYRTGRGRAVVRANLEVEEMHGNRQRIVVSEIPYQVNKARLVERIAELVKEKKIEGISDLRDESDRSGMRIVIELKRDANAKLLVNQLYKNTQLQDTFGINMLALVNNEPKTLNLKQMLTYYLEHQKDVVTRRTQYDLEKAQARAHILEGLLKALDYIDEIIRIIRASKVVAEAKEGLMNRFDFTDAQAQAIVDMRLRALTGLERERLENEYNELEARIEEYLAILSNEKILYGVIKEELLVIKAKYGDERRTFITYEEGEINLEDLIKNERSVITMTNLGYIKRTSLDMYHSQNRGGKGIKGIETRDGDYVKQLFIASTHDYLMFFTNRGKVYRMKAYEIPEAGRTARGIAIVNLLSLDGEERVSAVIQAKDMEEHGYLLMATRGGQIKKTDLSEYSNIRTNGLIAISLQEGDELIEVKKTDGRNDVFMATRKGQLIRFNEADVRATGRSSMGVRGITLNEEDEVIGMQLGNQGDSALAVTENGMGKRTALSEFSLQHRGGKGNLYYRITKKTGDVVSFKLVNKEQDLMLITDGGIIIRLRVEDISEIGRITSGVKLMGLEGDTKVVSIAKIREEQVEEDTDDPLAGMDFDDVAPEDE
ncbi:DNA gyrase subunit A [Bianquea renquensis]|uniref:DNA gyrase subunit A n=1 Tax=Bianquea renquensis TaxID=2763661 RepID=A0A926I1N0_9FIRM|nr:DNA gyrase subunit A [Bianquea renquensis]MBC8544429.1 DNA gyrase subunit A [Bianquea renquensis]